MPTHLGVELQQFLLAARSALLTLVQFAHHAADVHHGPLEPHQARGPPGALTTSRAPGGLSRPPRARPGLQSRQQRSIA